MNNKSDLEKSIYRQMDLRFKTIDIKRSDNLKDLIETLSLGYNTFSDIEKEILSNQDIEEFYNRAYQEEINNKDISKSSVYCLTLRLMAKEIKELREEIEGRDYLQKLLTWTNDCRKSLNLSQRQINDFCEELSKDFLNGLEERRKKYDQLADKLREKISKENFS